MAQILLGTKFALPAAHVHGSMVSYPFLCSLSDQAALAYGLGTRLLFVFFGDFVH